MFRAFSVVSALVVVISAVAACGPPRDPALPPLSPPQATPTNQPSTTPARAGTGDTTNRTDPVPPPMTVAPPVAVDPLAEMSLDDVNKAAALKPVFFTYDSDQLDDAARQVLSENSQVLKKYGRWIITVEGHCDERGSAEYNMALGDRRAQIARNYLISLGVSPDRLRTVSYGKEFPFDPGHDEAAWINNRRAQFMVTAR